MIRFVSKIKRFVGVALALALVVSMMGISVNVDAAEVTEVNDSSRRLTIQYGYINEDGVRLRETGTSSGTVLELMYYGDNVYYYPGIYGTDTNYRYMCRVSTGTYGYVYYSYVTVLY